jgi:hypothetical protein
MDIFHEGKVFWLKDDYYRIAGQVGPVHFQMESLDKFSYFNTPYWLLASEEVEEAFGVRVLNPTLKPKPKRADDRGKYIREDNETVFRTWGIKRGKK